MQKIGVCCEWVSAVGVGRRTSVGSGCILTRVFFFCPNLQFLSELKIKCPEETAQNDYNSDILSGRKCCEVPSFGQCEAKYQQNVSNSDT